MVSLKNMESLHENVSNEQKIVKYENQNLYSTQVPVLEQENIDDEGTNLHSETINEISDCQATSNNFRKNDEIRTCTTINLKPDKSDGGYGVSHSDLEESKIEKSQFESWEATENYVDDDDFGEFADFKTSNFDGNTNVFPVSTKVENVEQTEDDFAEFGDFENCKYTRDFKKSNNIDKVKEEPKQCRTEPKQDVVTGGEQDDLPDKSTFSKPSNDIDDDFDNFCDYSTFNRQNSGDGGTPGNNIKICKEPEEAFEQSQIILEDMFVPVKSDIENYINSDITLGSSVFENLKEITETNALMYQWEKSAAQKNILKTLNIDVRNILYGPTWNAGIPIFAANLCSTPLEPVKSEVTCSPLPHKPMESLEADRSNLGADVPLAEFDWRGAGLTNPLDCFEIVDKELETSDLSKAANGEVEIAHVTSVKSNESTSKQEQKYDVSISALTYTNEVPSKDAEQVLGNEEEDFSDFTSYQPSFEQAINQPWTGKVLPLRESHISYQSSYTKEASLIYQANVKPSVESATSNFNNFDLSFLESKPTSTETANVNNLSKPVDYSDVGLFSLMEKKSTDEEPSASFEDFRSFEMETNYREINNLHNNEIWSITSTVPDENVDVFSETTEISSKIMETHSKKSNISKNTEVEQSDQDDEFTDFHSSLPNQVNVPPTSTLSFPEPLKPAVLQPVSFGSVAKIEWPEPGLDEDEVSRIVAGCLRRKSETEVEVVRKSEPVPHVQEKKDNKKITGYQNDISGNDDEEWSDFVSVKEPSKSRTATPDLPLSVFNLGSIQPVKAPTPVLTPNGLICSPAKNALPNISVPKSNIKLQRNIQHHSKKHPFITSQAFDALYQNPRKNIGLVNNSFSETPRQITDQSSRNFKDQKTNIFDTYFDMTTTNVSNIGYITQQNETYGKFQSSPLSAPKSSEDDEEWGDFVSATSTVLPYNSNLNSVLSGTRVITNPSHLMGAISKNVSSDQYSSSNKGTVVRQENRNIPSISALPDLDFVSPRTRSAKK